MARGLSGYIDALIGGTIKETLRGAMPIDVDFLAEYPDFFSFGLVMLLSAILSIGVKESSMVNNIFTTLNLVTVCTVIIAGSIKGEINF